MTVKNFGFAARRAAGSKTATKDVPFTLKQGGPTFHVRGDVTRDSLAAFSVRFMEAEAEEGEDVVKAAKGMGSSLLKTMNHVFTEDSVRGLLTAIENRELTFDQLGEIIEWATEEHAGGRPTTSSRTS